MYDFRGAARPWIQKITGGDRDVKVEVDAVIFDLDGTLVDSAGIYFKLMEEVCSRLEIPVPSREELLERARVAKGDLKKLLPDKLRGKKDSVINKALMMIRQLFPEMFKDNVRIIPGAGELLRCLNETGGKIGIVTSTHQRSLDTKLIPLKKAGVVNLIGSIICIEDVPEFKPASDPLIECARRLAVQPEKSVYVGDSYVDIRAGKAARMKTVGVLTGMDSYETLKRENPDAILESVAQLLDVVEICGIRGIVENAVL